MAITATMVRELREMTGAAMMDCKKALEASAGDMQAAIDHLRKSGLKSAAKKAGRDTGEGRVIGSVSKDGHLGHLVAVECETDFLSASDGFKEFVDALAAHVRKNDPHALSEGTRPLLAQAWKDGANVEDAVKAAVGQFRENIRIASVARLENPEGRIGVYVHHDYKQGAIVSVTTGAGAAADEILKSLCQHIVVFRPEYAQREEVPAAAVERERAVILESDEVKRKPEEHREKIVLGKLSKFYAGTVLAEQPWIHDDKLTVAKALEKDLGAGTKIVSFVLAKIGG